MGNAYPFDDKLIAMVDGKRIENLILVAENSI